MEAEEDLLVAPVSIGQARDALWLVLSDLVAEERAERVGALLAEAREGRFSLDGLLEARRRGQLVAAMLYQVAPGRTAVVWPPRLAPDEPTTTAERLLAVAVERLHGEAVRAAHALLPTATAADDALMRTAGFEPLAQLLYLVSDRESWAALKESGPLEFEPYSEGNHARLARVVEATYHDSLDCPAMDESREIDDVLAGYRATGKFSPGRWLIARHAGEDVGCLLLADHPRQQNVELVYMGLVPSARGSDWGLQIARRGQAIARDLGRARLVLAVDSSNAPALKAYQAAGFEAWDTRHVYLKRM